MGLSGYFAKVVEGDGHKILGAHVIGPQASVLI
jgi:pyruvate/2-oxoglutarate dehydrogenase complex dihydrolipoamide dehydrogenase (E3) component